MPFPDVSSSPAVTATATRTATAPPPTTQAPRLADSAACAAPSERRGRRGMPLIASDYLASAWRMTQVTFCAPAAPVVDQSTVDFGLTGPTVMTLVSTTVSPLIFTKSTTTE